MSINVVQPDRSLRAVPAEPKKYGQAAAADAGRQLAKIAAL